ncbi:hypothetical protein Agabi119p4_10358 [Agaricus bisporus var. burnettii]|uniref:Uncharacterized protein n=1 Tax=Agaricus bisporus var. burnettii TaxID=192524 RepID=A0A8H7C1E1_AGABI|nr:hypothetical protein Agabi119p4_10358 [Agaricus bisporus var. burnettii]
MHREPLRKVDVHAPGSGLSGGNSDDEMGLSIRSGTPIEWPPTPPLRSHAVERNIAPPPIPAKGGSTSIEGPVIKVPVTVYPVPVSASYLDSKRSALRVRADSTQKIQPSRVVQMANRKPGNTIRIFQADLTQEVGLKKIESNDKPS